MGAEANRRLNGPWAVEVDFPGIFDPRFEPQTGDEIVDKLQLLTPPVPILGATISRWGEMGMPTGLVIKGAGPLHPIKLPVFEVGTYVKSLKSMVGPARYQNYFALNSKLAGEKYLSPRVCIGKVALLDEAVVCQMDVKQSAFGRKHKLEAMSDRRPTLEESVAQVIFDVLNGVSDEPAGTYERMLLANRMEASRRKSKLFQTVRQARKDR